MGDDKSKARQDRSRIAMREEYEVQYWTEELKVSKEELEEAVRAVGNYANKVRGYLERGK